MSRKKNTDSQTLQNTSRLLVGYQLTYTLGVRSIDYFVHWEWDRLTILIIESEMDWLFCSLGVRSIDYFVHWEWDRLTILFIESEIDWLFCSLGVRSIDYFVHWEWDRLNTLFIGSEIDWLFCLVRLKVKFRRLMDARVELSWVCELIMSYYENGIVRGLHRMLQACSEGV